jgi:hypothetical protein
MDFDQEQKGCIAGCPIILYKKRKKFLNPQLLQLYHALPKTVKSKVSFFLFLSNTIDVFGIQLSKKDDIDCDIGWANPRVIK